MPPRMPSAMLSFAVTAIWSPTARRTAITIRARPWRGSPSDPPNSSSRRLISGLRNELAKVAVAQMDLDGIEAGFDGEPCRVGVGGDDVVDVVAGGLLGEAHHERVEESTGASALALSTRAYGDGPGVADLRADRRALGVDRLGEPLQPRDGLAAATRSAGLRCVRPATPRSRRRSSCRHRPRRAAGDR